MRTSLLARPVNGILSFGVAACLLLPESAMGQDCGCDYTIPPDTLIVTGTELGVQPGEVICIEGGDREFLRFYDLVGTAEAPIVITNCGGQVVIDNVDRGYGLTLEGVEFTQITGTGDPAFEYGFSVRASRDGPDYSASCIVASGFSTDYELDHIEAFDCGFAGLSAKTDPSCDAQDLSGWVQRNTRVHHLYLHDTGGEGIYFGNTGFPSREGTCDGNTVDLIPHTHEGVWIHDNIIEDTGWDGAQIGVSPKDCYFYRNRIARVGLEGVEYQTNGLQIGGGSRCEITDNFISGGPSLGMIVLDARDTLIANNVIVDFLDGIYINDRDSEVTEGAQYRVLYNTVVDLEDGGITIFGARSVGNVLSNNLIVEGGLEPLGVGNDVDATTEGNLIVEAVAAARFSDPAGDDYSILEGSPAIGAGVDVSAYGVEVDQLGAVRDNMPDAGAFEFGVLPPDEVLSPPGPGNHPGGSDGGEDASASSNDDEGCGCRMVGKPTPARPYAFLLVPLVGLAFARSRRRWIGRAPT